MQEKRASLSLSFFLLSLWRLSFREQKTEYKKRGKEEEKQKTKASIYIYSLCRRGCHGSVIGNPQKGKSPYHAKLGRKRHLEDDDELKEGMKEEAKAGRRKEVTNSLQTFRARIYGGENMQRERR